MSKTKSKRSYVLRARAEQLAETRLRITEAIMTLHGEVGPRNTTVTAIAEKAGVERLTVYRHFANEAEMFQACSHRYLELHPPPRPQDWGDEADPARRTRRALKAIFSYFSETEAMFEKIYRDVPDFESLQEIMNGFDAYLQSLADDLAAAWPKDSAKQARMILRHAIKFATWQSFNADGVGDLQKVALIVDWLEASLNRSD